MDCIPLYNIYYKLYFYYCYQTAVFSDENDGGRAPTIIIIISGITFGATACG